MSEVVGIVQELMSFAGKCDSIQMYHIKDDDEVDALVEKKRDTLEFVWFDSGEYLKDPVYAFWRLVAANMLAHGCRCVFTGCDSVYAGWEDLERAYRGIKFGSLFVLTYSGNGKPTILPSQRGLFIKR